MRRHPTLDLDVDLVQKASAVRCTCKPGDTGHAALCEVARSHRRARLLELSTDLSLDDLGTMRVIQFSAPESRVSI